MAKLVIRLITRLGEVINGDPDCRGRLAVVFIPSSWAVSITASQPAESCFSGLTRFRVSSVRI